MRIHPVFHISLLEPAPRNAKLQTNANVETDENEYEVEQILAIAIAQQYQIDIGQASDIRKGGRDEFEVSLGVEQGAKSHKAQWIALHHGKTNGWFLR